jgi:hypothetical protein
MANLNKNKNQPNPNQFKTTGNPDNVAERLQAGEGPNVKNGDKNQQPKQQQFETLNIGVNQQEYDIIIKNGNKLNPAVQNTNPIPINQNNDQTVELNRQNVEIDLQSDENVVYDENNSQYGINNQMETLGTPIKKFVPPTFDQVLPTIISFINPHLQPSLNPTTVPSNVLKLQKELFAQNKTASKTVPLSSSLHTVLPSYYTLDSQIFASLNTDDTWTWFQELVADEVVVKLVVDKFENCVGYCVVNKLA